MRTPGKFANYSNALAQPLSYDSPFGNGEGSRLIHHLLEVTVVLSQGQLSGDDDIPF
jgi:hypothetical protein